MSRLRDPLVRSVRGALAAAIVVALTAQFLHGRTFATFRPANFFSYFTVLSNISAAVVLGVLAARPDTEAHPTTGLLRGAVTLYMTVTGIVYALVLAPADVDLDTNLVWVDVIVHQVAPVVVLADFLVRRPARQPSWPAAAAWLAFPAVWLGYTVVRGPAADWYPYPFLDARTKDAAEIAVGCMVIGAVMVALAAGLRWWAGRTDARVA